MKNENKIKHLKVGAAEYKTEIARLEAEITYFEASPEIDHRDAKIAGNYQFILDNLACLQTIYEELRDAAK